MKARQVRWAGSGPVWGILLGLVLAMPAGAVADAPAPEAAAEIAEEAQAPAATAPAEPPPVPAAEALARAWSSRGKLPDRVSAVRRAAFGRGIRSVDPVARSLLLEEVGDPLDRARAAVSLAPDLPDARLALARALGSSGSPGEALSATWAALASLRATHLEAALAFDAALWIVLAQAALLGGALFLLAAALTTAPSAGRQVAAGWPGGLPTVSGFAWVAVAVAAPAALGEGLAGLALGAALLAIAYGSPSLRIATVAAVALASLGLHPLADGAGRAVASFSADPVARAAWRTERGLATPLEIARLERAAGVHPLAERALALHDRREGRLDLADRRFRSLIARIDADARVIHNAANVRFALGRDAEAIELYERAIATASSAASWWNLSQAHGRAIQIDAQDAALQEAQKLDASFVSELTASAAGPTPVLPDLPLDVATARASARAAAPARGGGAPLRDAWAPGLLGRHLFSSLGIFAGLALVAALAGAWLRSLPSASADEDVYAGIARVLQGREATDPSLRRARLSALRERRQRHDRIALGFALVVPGVAGVQARHAFLGLAAACLFAIALACVRTRGELAAGGAAGGETLALGLGLVAGLSALLYVAATAAALVVRMRG